MPYHQAYFREGFPMPTTKVTVNLPDDTVEALKGIAEERGTTVTEALRQVIESQRFLQDEMKTGNKVLLQDPNDKSVRQVIFNTPVKSKANSA
jgi:metal-responsive CopG/Arc/MetJ family transcriptional regulator